MLNEKQTDELSTILAEVMTEYPHIQGRITKKGNIVCRFSDNTNEIDESVFEELIHIMIDELNKTKILDVKLKDYGWIRDTDTNYIEFRLKVKNIYEVKLNLQWLNFIWNTIIYKYNN